MATRRVSIEVPVRNSDGVVDYVENAMSGYTDDDGKTIVIPNGYVPNIGKAFPNEVRVILHTDPEEKTGTFVSRVDDSEANTSTIRLAING